MPRYWCRNCRSTLSKGDTVCSHCEATIAIERPTSSFSLVVSLTHNPTATMLHHLEEHFALSWDWFDEGRLARFLNTTFNQVIKRFTKDLKKAQT
jgi:hypothetical protein